MNLGWLSTIQILCLSPSLRPNRRTQEHESDALTWDTEPLKKKKRQRKVEKNIVNDNENDQNEMR